MKLLNNDNLISATLFGLSVFSFSYLNKIRQFSITPNIDAKKLFDIPVPKLIHKKLLDVDLKSKVLIVGDIHGCLDEFKLLLEKCNYNPLDSSVILVGDLVNKGYFLLIKLDFSS